MGLMMGVGVYGGKRPYQAVMPAPRCVYFLDRCPTIQQLAGCAQNLQGLKAAMFASEKLFLR